MTSEQEAILEFRRGENPKDDNRKYVCCECLYESTNGGLDMSPTDEGDICDDDKACRDRRVSERLRCNCGSKKCKEAQYDGHGLFLTYTCEDCHAKKMSGYRSDIHSQYECDEPIEADY